MRGLSSKQLRAASFGDREGLYHLMVGPIRSGKSVSGLRGFWHWASSRFSGHDFCVAAKSSKQWEAVILGSLRSFAEDNGLVLRRRTDHYELTDARGGINRFWRVVGGEGGTSASRLEGMTFAGAYVDDAAFVPEILLDTIADRCSIVGAKIVMSLYPQGPFHPIKQKYVDPIEAGDKAGDVTSFNLADNPSLSAQYVDALRERWRGQPHEYQRRIEGRWAAASGLIYGNFHRQIIKAKAADLESQIWRWEVACDWASSSVTYGLLLGRHYDGSTIAMDEWHHDGRIEGTLATEQQAEAMIAYFGDGSKRSITSWIVDPSADGLIVALRGRVQGEVIHAVADVDEGIRVAGNWIETGQIKFLATKCPRLMGDLGSYLWDEEMAARGLDVPDKDSADGAHCADGFRYYCHTRTAHEEAQRVSAGAA